MRGCKLIKQYDFSVICMRPRQLFCCSRAFCKDDCKLIKQYDFSKKYEAEQRTTWRPRKSHTRKMSHPNTEIYQTRETKLRKKWDFFNDNWGGNFRNDTSQPEVIGAPSKTKTPARGAILVKKGWPDSLLGRGKMSRGIRGVKRALIVVTSAPQAIVESSLLPNAFYYSYLWPRRFAGCLVSVNFGSGWRHDYWSFHQLD